MFGYELLLLTFNQFVNEKIINPLLENPIIIIGILVGLSAYFGYFCSFHMIKGSPYFKKVFGLFIVVYHFGFFLLIAYFIIWILPFTVFENRIVLTLIEIFIILYTTISTISIVLISEKCDASFTFKELFPKYISLPFGFVAKYISLVYLIIISLAPLIQIIAGYIIITYEDSIAIGLFLLSLVFLNLSFYCIYLGISQESYKYAEIFLKIPKQKSIKGRLKKIDDSSVDVLVKKETGNYLTEIPLDNVSRIELRNLEEITKKIKR